MGQLSGEVRGGNGFNVTTAGRGMGAVKPISSFRPYTPPPPAPTYQAWNPAPVYQPQPQAPAYQPQNTQNGNWGGPAQQNIVQGSPGGVASGGGGYSGGGGGFTTAPVSPPKPPPPPRLTADDFAAKYKNNDKGLAITDATFADQQSQYANILKKYIEDYTRQGKTLRADTATANEGIARNKQNGLTSQAEDFFARGLGNSGLFSQEQDKATAQYDRQKANVNKSLTDQLATLDFNKSKKETETQANTQNARRDAYNRLALRQQLQ